MDRRFLAALAVSALVLLAYPHYLKWVGLAPREGTQPPASPSEKVIPAPTAAPEFKPPVPAEKLSFENELYDVVSTTQGGNLLLLRQGNVTFFEAGPDNGGIFGVTLEPGAEGLSGEIFEKVPAAEKDQGLEFVYEKPRDFRLTKRYFIGKEKPTLVLEVETEDLSGRERNFSVGLNYGLDLVFHTSQEEGMVKVIRSSGGEVGRTDLRAIRKAQVPLIGTESLDWHGLVRKYYALLVKPDSKIVGHEARVERDKLMSRLRLAPFTLTAGGRHVTRILVYAGPQRQETLREFGMGFEKILSQGTLGPLRGGLLRGLNFFYRLTQNYGTAVLLATLLIKLLFTPLTHLSYKSMKKMQALQPKLKALQRQYKDDAGRLNKETMELYRRNRVNPMMGCLPLVLQVPIFIAFYRVLAESVELKGAPFIFWIRDLSEPDRLFSWSGAIPFVGNSFNLLPLLMIGSMLWQQRLTPQTAADPGQEKIMYLMPVVFGLVFYSLPSGLVLYWTANNLLTIFHQLFVKRIPVSLHHEDR